MDKSIGLYIHIPFCKSKCYYCDFTSFAHKNEWMSPYVLALCEEIKQYGKIFQNKKVNTIFIGGGTPTVLPQYLFKTLLEVLLDSFNIEHNVEFTVEGNPGTLNNEMLYLLKEYNVNRLSIGLQAYQNNLLKAIGRIHDVEEFSHNYYLAKKMGYNNINVDLMFSLPNQTIKDWIDTLEFITMINPEHISCYSLMIEEDTPFGQLKREGKLKECTEETDRTMYHYAKSFLEAKGYHHYEISNFSKPGFESKHNLIYWKYKPYIGMGLGAHSFIHGERYHNTYDLKKYIEINGRIKNLKKDIETVSLEMKYAEYLFLGLRLIEGISIKEFNSKFKISFDALFEDKVKKLTDMKLLLKNGDNIRLTSKGLDVCNIVFAEFLP